MNKSFRLAIFLGLINLILFNLLFYYLIKFSTIDAFQIFYLYNLFSILIFILLFIFIIKISGLFSIHSISTFFIFLFLYGRSTVYIFQPNYDFFQTDLLSYDDIGYTNMLLALIVVNLFVFSLNAVYVLFGKPDQVILNIDSKTKSDERLLFYISIFSGILYVCKLIIEYYNILEVGYVAMYAGGLKSINYYSFLIKYSHVIFLSFFSYYLTIVSDKKKFLIISAIYLLTSFLDSLKGARVALILPLFFLLWYYNCLFRININFKLLYRSLFILLFIGIFSIYSKSKRNNLEMNLSVNIIKAVVTETGSTLQLIGRYIKHKDQIISSYPFFLEPILYPYFYFKNFSVFTQGQSEELLEYRNSFNHQFSAFVNKQAYLVGSGMGSSSPLEFYQFGVIPLILLSFLYGIILILFYKSFDTRIIIYMSTILVLHFMIFARETPFPNLIGILKALFTYYSIKYILLIKKSIVKVY